MPDGIKFPKLRKFATHTPDACLEKTRLLEYTNYDVTPPMTYRIERNANDKWDWEILQCGWQIRQSPQDKHYDSDLDAYRALRHAVVSCA